VNVRIDPLSDRIEIRRELRPGDLGEVVAMHGRLYSREYGLDATFEGHVASAVARAAIQGWPSEREGVWIVERGGRFAGSLALTDEGDQTGVLRWFLLDSSLRGRGLGRRLVGELLAEAQAKGFTRVRLETFSELRAAAHLYRAHGFALVREQTGPRWGRDEITYQHYELELDRRDRRISDAPTLARTA
jgi:ribosomal protein S18 acetylase RimI-like enzyme